MRFAVYDKAGVWLMYVLGNDAEHALRLAKADDHRADYVRHMPLSEKE